MIARAARARSGITLTEILIAILIMGVGLISLATLFPLGLIRLREATRNSRAGLTFETAADDMDTRALFYKPSFTQTWYWTRHGNGQGPPRPVRPGRRHSTGPQRRGSGGVIASGSLPGSTTWASSQRPAVLLRPALAVDHRHRPQRRAVRPDPGYFRRPTSAAPPAP